MGSFLIQHTHIQTYRIEVLKMYQQCVSCRPNNTRAEFFLFLFRVIFFIIMLLLFNSIITVQLTRYSNCYCTVVLRILCVCPHHTVRVRKITRIHVYSLCMPCLVRTMRAFVVFLARYIVNWTHTEWHIFASPCFFSPHLWLYFFSPSPPTNRIDCIIVYVRMYIYVDSRPCRTRSETFQDPRVQCKQQAINIYF